MHFCHWYRMICLFRKKDGGEAGIPGAVGSYCDRIALSKNALVDYMFRRAFVDNKLSMGHVN